jgi:hypothetical protein
MPGAPIVVPSNVQIVPGQTTGPLQSAAVQDGVSVFEQAQQQTIWYIDPANSTGNARDVNFGADPQHPVLSYSGGVAAKWGTTAPTFRNMTVTLIWMSSQPTDSVDPVVFTPYTENAQVIIQGTQTVLFSGTLAGVISKNRATAQILTANLGFNAPIGTLVKNTTVGKVSYAFIFQLVSGTTYLLSQPLEPQTIPVSTFPTIVEVDTWADGDTFEIVATSAANISVLDVTPVQYIVDGGAFPEPLQLYQITAESADGTAFDNNMLFGLQIAFVETTFNIIPTAFPSGAYDEPGLFINCSCTTGVSAMGVYGGEISYFAGFIFQNGLNSGCSWSFDFDAILSSTDGFSFVIGAPAISTGESETIAGQGLLCILGTVYASLTTSFTPVSAFSSESILWGSGTLDSIGSARIAYDAGDAVATFLNTGGLKLNGQTSANPFQPSSGTWEPAIAITPAHLDAAFGVAGFGGLAVNVGGASISGQATS